MNCSAKILVTLATVLTTPLLLAAGLVIGAAVAVKFAYLWLEFVWEEM